MKRKILAFGEIIWDTYPDGATLGGAPLNFAAHCQKCGAESYLLSAVGNDELGTRTKDMLADWGVRTDFLQTNALPTGRCLVELDGAGIPAYRIQKDVAYDEISVDGETIEGLVKTGFDALCSGTLAQRRAASRRALLEVLENVRFTEVFCDINLRDGCFDELSLLHCFSHATTLKMSEEEEPRLRAFAFWRAFGEGDIVAKSEKLFLRFPQLRRILYTRGGDGAWLLERGKDKIVVPAVRLGALVSTVGAGDSFGAVWLVAYMGGMSAEEAARLAAKVSGFVVTQKGAVPDYDLERFLG